MIKQIQITEIHLSSEEIKLYICQQDTVGNDGEKQNVL